METISPISCKSQFAKKGELLIHSTKSNAIFGENTSWNDAFEDKISLSGEDFSFNEFFRDPESYLNYQNAQSSIEDILTFLNNNIDKFNQIDIRPCSPFPILDPNEKNFIMCGDIENSDQTGSDSTSYYNSSSSEMQESSDCSSSSYTPSPYSEGCATKNDESDDSSDDSDKKKDNSNQDKINSSDKKRSHKKKRKIHKHKKNSKKLIDKSIEKVRVNETAKDNKKQSDNKSKTEKESNFHQGNQDKNVISRKSANQSKNVDHEGSKRTTKQPIKQNTNDVRTNFLNHSKSSCSSISISPISHSIEMHSGGSRNNIQVIPKAKPSNNDDKMPYELTNPVSIYFKKGRDNRQIQQKNNTNPKSTASSNYQNKQTSYKQNNNNNYQQYSTQSNINYNDSFSQAHQKYPSANAEVINLHAYSQNQQTQAIQNEQLYHQQSFNQLPQINVNDQAYQMQPSAPNGQQAYQFPQMNHYNYSQYQNDQYNQQSLMYQNYQNDQQFYQQQQYQQPIAYQQVQIPQQYQNETYYNQQQSYQNYQSYQQPQVYQNDQPYQQSQSYQNYQPYQQPQTFIQDQPNVLQISKQPSYHNQENQKEIFSSQLYFQNKIQYSIEQKVLSKIVYENPLFSSAMSNNELIINPYQLEFEPKSYWEDFKGNITFRQLVNSFFRINDSRVFKFIYKLYDMLLLTSKIQMYKGIIGVSWITDKIFIVNAESMASMLNLKQSSYEDILFGKNQYFASHGFVEITPENCHEAGLENYPDIFDPNIKLMFHIDQMFVNKEISTKLLDEIERKYDSQSGSRYINFKVNRPKYPAYSS